jgi:hypothetical protein
MSVHLALQALVCAQGPAQAQLVAQARQIVELQALLEGQIALGRAHTDQAQQSYSAAQSQIGSALHNFSQRVLRTGLDNALTVRDPFLVEQAFGRLNTESIQPPLQQAAQALQPMRIKRGGNSHSKLHPHHVDMFMRRSAFIALRASEGPGS